MQAEGRVEEEEGLVDLSPDLVEHPSGLWPPSPWGDMPSALNKKMSEQRSYIICPWCVIQNQIYLVEKALLFLLLRCVKHSARQALWKRHRHRTQPQIQDAITLTGTASVTQKARNIIEKKLPAIRTRKENLEDQNKSSNIQQIRVLGKGRKWKRGNRRNRRKFPRTERHELAD